MTHTIYSERFASHPDDVKNYDTSKLREHFLIEGLFTTNSVKMVYSHFDRFITGAALPVNQALSLETIEPLKADFFLQRREIGIINIGSTGTILVDGTIYQLNYKEALYIGKGNKEIIFASADEANPARFYFNSAPAHCTYPTKLISLNKAIAIDTGSAATSNARTINKLIINGIVDTCQLQMGLTELKPGSVWNTMPPHVHSRRMEVYMYFEVPEGQAICHYMGQPQETRHIWMQNQEAVISPNWSIHSAAGTSNYSFIWGMAGENLDYNDMDTVQPNKLR